jgi:hypothetical protein
MPSTSEPMHLSSHHRNTLRKIFQHPAGHNIAWRAVVSLLEAIGTVEAHRDDKVEVTVGSGPKMNGEVLRSAWVAGGVGRGQAAWMGSKRTVKPSALAWRVRRRIAACGSRLVK